ncbi:type II toxin-antitoxin system VapC family toxin [Methanobrevibacter filiformis]|uniref:PIN domain protein n=1 Tax=Methanobrevibacter filiformis TaxID=55758 RepID=A0A166A2P9_9EURY|nr:PIN domain-containing protein [Methanobrevibacter filiformis]KZX11484.1 PIN domain protein [Methanobrevibacter filiformis]
MIFLDASFLIAIFVENDQWHQDAVKLLPKISKKKKFISKLVIAETITNLTHNLRAKEIREIYNNIIENFTIIDESDFYNEAMKVFIHYDAKLSFFDSMYIKIMELNGISEIASFDKHFDNKNHVVRLH